MSTVGKENVSPNLEATRQLIEVLDAYREVLDAKANTFDSDLKKNTRFDFHALISKEIKRRVIESLVKNNIPIKSEDDETKMTLESKQELGYTNFKLKKKKKMSVIEEEEEIPKIKKNSWKVFPSPLKIDNPKTESVDKIKMDPETKDNSQSQCSPLFLAAPMLDKGTSMSSVKKPNKNELSFFKKPQDKSMSSSSHIEPRIHPMLETPKRHGQIDKSNERQRSPLMRLITSAVSSLSGFKNAIFGNNPAPESQIFVKDDGRLVRNSTSFKPHRNDKQDELLQMASKSSLPQIVETLVERMSKAQELHRKSLLIEEKISLHFQNNPDQNNPEGIHKHFSRSFKIEEGDSRQSNSRRDDSEGAKFYESLKAESVHDMTNRFEKKNCNPSYLSEEHSVPTQYQAHQDEPVTFYSQPGPPKDQSELNRTNTSVFAQDRIPFGEIYSRVAEDSQPLVTSQPVDDQQDIEVQSDGYSISTYESEAREHSSPKKEDCELSGRVPYHKDIYRDILQRELDKIKRWAGRTSPPQPLPISRSQSNNPLTKSTVKELNDITPLKMKRPLPSDKSEPEEERETVYIINGKRVPYWATDKDFIQKMVRMQNISKKYKTTFGRLRPMKQLDVNEFFPPELMASYRR